MSQGNQIPNSVPVENLPVKRKRGRPRKNENLIRGVNASMSVPDVVKRNRHRRADRKSSAVDPMVGQVVTGVIDGSFDAGYLLTVRVGNTSRVLKGIVFEPRLSVPISGENDIAPQVKMVKRIHVSLDKPAQIHSYPANQLKQKSKSPVKLPSKNEGSIPTKVSSPAKQAPQVATQVSNGVPNDVNRDSQDADHSLQQAEIHTENQVPQFSTRATENKKKVIDLLLNAETVLPSITTKSQAVTTQLIAELSHMLQDNQTSKNSDPTLDIKTKLPAEQILGIDETSSLNEWANVISKDADSAPKTTQLVQKMEIDGIASQQSVLVSKTGEPQMSNSSILLSSKSKYLGIGDGVSSVQSHNDLFSDTDSIG